MAVVGQTITIVNKSGKIVSSSKHLVNVFNEAKSAYNERKAELRASRREKAEKSEERKLRNRIETITLDDDESDLSRRSSRRGSQDGRRPDQSHRRTVSDRTRTERPPIERGVSDSFYTNESSRNHRRQSSNRPTPLRQHSSNSEDEPHIRELTRRHTDGLALSKDRPRKPSRRASADDVDMDLAYGELPPPLPERNYDTEIELRQKMTGLQRVLEEANCLQHSVTAIIDNLQKNPDALAAVALTLAEISNLAAKMAPGALMSMKGAFPAIIALLASPEFMIAAGVGVGVTIIALGGYKIIKKIKAKKAEDNSELLIEPSPGTPESEMQSLRELDRIELWRRGIADVEADSTGTSVDGEFVTPGARQALIKDGKLTEADFKKDKKKKKHRSSKSESGMSEGGSSRSGRKAKTKKESSGIRMLFKGRSEKVADVL